MRLAIIGDCHGQQNALRCMLARIEGHGVDMVVSLGDLLDRGPDSLGALRLARTYRFRTRSGRRRRIEVIAGNHELSYVACARRTPVRLRDDRVVVPVPREPAILNGLTPDEIDWLAGLPRYLSVQNGGLHLLLVHGGIRREHARVPGWLCKREKVDGLTRIGYLDEVTGEPLHPSQTSRVHWADRYEPEHGPLVVFGHTTFGPRITWFPNAIGVDCSKAGVLAALILEAGKAAIELYEEHESTAGWLTGLCSPTSAAW